MRALTEVEKKVVEQFANHVEERSRQQLMRELEHSTVEDETPDSSRIRFIIAGYTRPPYQGQHPFGVEGRMLDRDDVELSVVLYADENERLFELEFIRWGDGALLEPKLDTFLCIDTSAAPDRS
jgi:hypothetical protein